MGELTIKDIAKMAGVSHTTVSRVLNGGSNVKPETSERIIQLCRETGFTRNAAARHLKKGTYKTLGIIVPDVSNAYFGELIRNIEWEAKKKGFQVFISSSFHDYAIEEQNIQAMLEQRVDGIFISGVGDKTYIGLEKYLDKVPILFLGDNIPDKFVSRVTVDGYSGVVMGAKYLLSLGHRHLAFLGGRESSITHQRRMKGFQDAMEAADGVTYEFFTITSGSNIEDGRQTGLTYFNYCLQNQKPLPSAIMTINDYFALGIMQAAVEMDIHIPQQISIIGFDNIVYASLPRIQLTTISQPKEEICARAMKTLLQLIDENTPAKTIYNETIQPELLIRETCIPWANKE